MHFIVPLAGLLGIETDVLLDRLKKNAIVSLAIALFVLIGLGFLLVAANTAMIAWVGPIWGPLMIAGAAIVIALLIFALSRIGEGKSKARLVERRRSSETSAFVTTAALTALPLLLKSPMARNIAIPLAVLGAFALLARNRSSPGEND